VLLPNEFKEIKGFSSIPPFLRVFPDKIALSNVLPQSK